MKLRKWLDLVSWEIEVEILENKTEKKLYKGCVDKIPENLLISELKWVDKGYKEYSLVISVEKTDHTITVEGAKYCVPPEMVDAVLEVLNGKNADVIPTLKAPPFLNSTEENDKVNGSPCDNEAFMAEIIKWGERAKSMSEYFEINKLSENFQNLFGEPNKMKEELLKLLYSVLNALHNNAASVVLPDNSYTDYSAARVFCKIFGFTWDENKKTIILDKKP